VIPVITRFTTFVIVRAISVGGIKQAFVSDVCPSVAYIEFNSRKERPWKTKIGTEVAHIKCDTNESFKVKRSPHSSLEFIISTHHTKTFVHLLFFIGN